MYRMQNRKKDIRIYVRNKARYNPEAKERDFLYVDITDFAGTTIGDIKENIRRQTRGAVKIDELFLNNVSLADDRSVAHYNLEDGSILETTSNPLWVSCLYIKAEEVKQQQRLNPADENVQKWTSKSLPKKYTIIGILLNSSNAYRSQPPHFPNLQDLVQYLESLGKKGATMHPNYTQADLAKMELEFHQDFENRYNDPIAAFVDHHAVQLGYIRPDEAERKLRQPAQTPQNRPVMNYPSNGVPVSGNRGRLGVGGDAGGNRNNNNRRQVQICEDCERSLAVVYCTECQNAADGHGISLCKHCSDLLHTGATRRRHNITDIAQAPKTANTKPYVPRAFLAPFSILVAMFSALSDRIPKLSMTEDEIKLRAQSLTDTDLQDKQNGKYVGGFDCMENCLMAKGLVKKEASRTPTYALTDLGHALGEKLLLFSTKLFDYLSSCHLPKLPDTISTTCVGNRKICLLIDENERDKGRLLKFAEDKGIEAQTRYLPAGDYIWILTPPMIDTRLKYTGKQPDAEMVLPFIVERKSWEDFENCVNSSTRFQRQVLPFIVERKSWEDFENSVNSTRFQRQVNNMLGSGVKNCFYLMEGSPGALRYNATQQHQQHLKAMVEKLTFDYGFYVNYTASWMKSAQWLLWLTQLIVEAYKKGKLVDSAIPYSDFSSRVAILNGGHPPGFHGNQNRQTHTWPAQLFVDHIFRDELGDRTLIKTVQEDIGLQGSEKHLLVVQGLEQYNKKRQSTLNKCCTEVYEKPHQAEGIVEKMIGACIHNMVHYDITCYKQLYIQVMTGVYVMRTETDKETNQAHQEFMAGPKPPPPVSGSNRQQGRQPPRKQKSPKSASSSSTTNILAAMNPFTSPSLTYRSLTSPSHTDPEDNSLNLLCRLTADRDVGLDLPPGCRVANTPLSRQPALSSSRSEIGHSFKAFSGQGFALGSGSSGNTPNRARKPTATVTSERQIQQLDNSARNDSSRNVFPVERLDDRNVHQIGPSGDSSRQNYGINSAIDRHGINSPGNIGIPRIGSRSGSHNLSWSGDGTDNVGNRPLGFGDSDMAASLGSSGIGTGDFADPQNEDLIFQEVLKKSKQEAGPIATDSQEDPELQLALMLSKEDNLNTTALDQNTHRSDQSNVNNQSKADNQSKMDKYSSNRENPERDKVETIEIEDSQEEIDDSLKLALVISKLDNNVVEKVNNVEVSEEKGNVHIDQRKDPIDSSGTDTVISIEDVVAVDDDDDVQLKLAIEMSKQTNTPEKILDKDSDGSDPHLLEVIERSKIDHTPEKAKDFDDYLKTAIEVSIQESSLDHEDPVLQEIIERSKVDHTPIKVADHDLELEKAIKMSMIEHSPKRVENEDRHLKLAIERSIIEQSPKLSAVKRKLDTSDSCDIREKIVRNYEDIQTIHGQESDYPNIKETETSYNAEHLNDMKTKESENEAVILIDSESQGLESEDAEMDSLPVQETVDSETIMSNTLSNGLDETKDKYFSFNEKVKDNIQNQSEYVLRNPGEGSNQSEVSSSVDNIRYDFEPNDDCDDDDFVPPSPDKSASNLSQLNLSLHSSASFTPLSTSLSRSSKVETEPFMSESEKLEASKTNHNNNNNSRQNEQTGKTNKDKVGSKVTDFSLKTSLLRFADEEGSESDYDSFDDDNDDDDDDDDDDNDDNCEGNGIKGSDNDSFKSAEDMFNQTDCDTESGSGSRTQIGVQDKNSSINQVPCVNESENMPNIFRVNNLVNVSEVNQGFTSSNDFNSNPDSCYGRQSNNGGSLPEQNKNMSPTVTIVTNIKTEKDVDSDKVNESPKDKRTTAFKQKSADLSTSSVDCYSTYDSQMDEIDFNPDLDDIDNDPTYEAGKSDQDSPESSDNNVYEDDSNGDDLDELISKVDPEFLPPISRPKKRRKKTPKKETVKKTATSPKTKSVKVKQEYTDYVHVKVKEESPDTRTEMDAALARLLDQHINKSTSSSTNCSTSNLANSDIEYTRHIKVEEESDLPELPEFNIDSGNDEKLAQQNRTILNSKPTTHNETEDLVKELQRRELEKLERRRRLLEEDERIARMMQDNPDQDQGKADVIPIDVKDPIDDKASDIPRNFKKLFAEDRAMREKAAAQVDEYRRIQSQRYQSASTPGQSPSAFRHTPATQGHTAATLGHTSGTYGHTTGSTGNNQYGKPVNDRSNSPFGDNTFNMPSQSMRDNFAISQPQAGQLTPSNKVSQSQSSNLPFTQSETGQLTPHSQSRPSAAERGLNSTCGNCGEKGHTRVNPNCPRYHTAEETARRDAQQESRRQKQEEKKREEQENINMLSRHQRAILEMNNQIQAEVSAIQNNLNQRARELERQVNSRVKKMENAEKRKKKK